MSKGICINCKHFGEIVNENLNLGECCANLKQFRTKEKARSKPIKPRSDKRAKQEKYYLNTLLPQLFEAHPICEVEGCNNKSTEGHHIEGRIGDLLTDINNLLAVCHDCHVKIEKEPNWAKEKGYSKNRL